MQGIRGRTRNSIQNEMERKNLQKKERLPCDKLSKILLLLSSWRITGSIFFFFLLLPF